MAIKRVLLPINGRDNMTPVAELAFGIAGKAGAAIEVLHPYTPYYEVITAVTDGGSPIQINREIESAKKRFEDENVNAKKLFDQTSQAHAGVAMEFVEIAGKAGEIVSQRAFSSDLIVLGSASTYDSQFWRDAYDGALFSSTRPVLVAPVKPMAADAIAAVASNVLVAWGGTAESARAFSAAESFFPGSKQVQILTVTDDKRKIESAERMKSLAALHGANASVKVVDPAGRNIAETILDEAAATPNTLLVMGAYSHSRWRERFLGGVTEHVLHHSTVPVLMAH